MPQFYCFHCGQHIDAHADLSGWEVDCPACGGAITVPGLHRSDAPSGAEFSLEFMPVEMLPPIAAPVALPESKQEPETATPEPPAVMPPAVPEQPALPEPPPKSAPPLTDEKSEAPHATIAESRRAEETPPVHAVVATQPFFLISVSSAPESPPITFSPFPIAPTPEPPPAKPAAAEKIQAVPLTPSVKPASAEPKEPPAAEIPTPLPSVVPTPSGPVPEVVEEAPVSTKSEAAPSPLPDSAVEKAPLEPALSTAEPALSSPAGPAPKPHWEPSRKFVPIEPPGEAPVPLTTLPSTVVFIVWMVGGALAQLGVMLGAGQNSVIRDRCQESLTFLLCSSLVVLAATGVLGFLLGIPVAMVRKRAAGVFGSSFCIAALALGLLLLGSGSLWYRNGWPGIAPALNAILSPLKTVPTRKAKVSDGE